MPWERRGQNRYYYRARRVGPVVKKQYCGKGPIAESAARQDAEVRRRRAEGQAAIRKIREPLTPVLDLMRQLDTGVRMLCDGSLLTAGYHQNKGVWRKRRG